MFCKFGNERASEKLKEEREKKRLVVTDVLMLETSRSVLAEGCWEQNGVG